MRARVREGLVYNVSNEIHVDFYVIVTERNTLKDERAKMKIIISGCACAGVRDENTCTYKFHDCLRERARVREGLIYNVSRFT